MESKLLQRSGLTFRRPLFDSQTDSLRVTWVFKLWLRPLSCSFWKPFTVIGALLAQILCLQASEPLTVNYEWYPQTAGQQLESTDWRLQEENLPIWNSSWNCLIKRDRICAIEHLEKFLDRELEEEQLILVHNALAQNYLQVVRAAMVRKDRAAIAAVEAEIEKLNKKAITVKILNHTLVEADVRARDWQSCTERGTTLMKTKEMEEFLLSAQFPMILAQCHAFLGERKEARRLVRWFFTESGHTRESLAIYEPVFQDLGL